MSHKIDWTNSGSDGTMVGIAYNEFKELKRKADLADEMVFVIEKIQTGARSQTPHRGMSWKEVDDLSSAILKRYKECAA